MIEERREKIEERTKNGLETKKGLEIADANIYTLLNERITSFATDLYIAGQYNAIKTCPKRTNFCLIRSHSLVEQSIYYSALILDRHVLSQ